MSGPLIRIISDVHFGDHASRVGRLAQLRPLLDGVSHLVLNGDTLDTRSGPFPAHTAECRAAVDDFFPRHVPASSFLTGNHDADFSPLHHLDLAGGKVFVTHGDIFFNDIVPWSHDATLIGRRIADEMRSVPAEFHDHLDHRLAVFRKVAMSIPQRHQSERNRLKFALHYLADTIWPPSRIVRVIRAWRVAPSRAAEITRHHRPNADFVLCGHTHRPGIWSAAKDVTVINTGSFCPPLGGYFVDLQEGRIIVRRLDFRAGEFRAGDSVATFPLAETSPFNGKRCMSIEFGWWNKDEDGRKYQVHAVVHGGNIEWTRHQGHHASWAPHVPTDDDRSRLVFEAEKRVPRRLISQKQFEEIKRLSENEGSGHISGRRSRSSPEL